MAKLTIIKAKDLSKKSDPELTELLLAESKKLATLNASFTKNPGAERGVIKKTIARIKTIQAARTK